MGCQPGDFRQCSDGIQCSHHLALGHFMGDHHDLSAGCTGIELNDRLDRNAPIAETAAHLADHTRGIFGVQPHIVPLADGAAVRQHAGSPAPRRQQRVDAAIVATGLADPGDVQDVCHHSGGRGACSCTGAVEHHPANRIAFHEDGVVHPVHPSQRMVAWDQGWLHPQG